MIHLLNYLVIMENIGPKATISAIFFDLKLFILIR